VFFPSSKPVLEVCEGLKLLYLCQILLSTGCTLGAALSHILRQLSQNITFGTRGNEIPLEKEFTPSKTVICSGRKVFQEGQETYRFL
jgi:hypothetical protein